MSDDNFIVVLVTAGSSEEADCIAGAIVQEQLAACVNILGPTRSVYSWQGHLERADEVLLIVKTRAALFTALEDRIRELHSYENPEIVGLPILLGAAPYLDWVRENTP